MRHAAGVCCGDESVQIKKNASKSYTQPAIFPPRQRVLGPGWIPGPAIGQTLKGEAPTSGDDEVVGWLRVHLKYTCPPCYNESEASPFM